VCWKPKNELPDNEQQPQRAPGPLAFSYPPFRAQHSALPRSLLTPVAASDFHAATGPLVVVVVVVVVERGPAQREKTG
jgi:hypothetical protein